MPTNNAVTILDLNDLRPVGKPIRPWSNHPHFGRNKCYPISIPITDELAQLRFEIYGWLNEHTTEPYSLDHTVLTDGSNRMGWHASFQNMTDMMMFKLAWVGVYD